MRSDGTVKQCGSAGFLVAPKPYRLCPLHSVFSWVIGAYQNESAQNKTRTPVERISWRNRCDKWSFLFFCRFGIVPERLSWWMKIVCVYRVGSMNEIWSVNVKTNMTSKYDRIKTECKSKNVLWEDPDFPAIQSSVFYYQTPPFTFQWKRISEIVPSPQFINDGEKFDIIPGKMGTYTESISTKPHRNIRRNEIHTRPEKKYERVKTIKRNNNHIQTRSIRRRPLARFVLRNFIFVEKSILSRRSGWSKLRKLLRRFSVSPVVVRWMGGSSSRWQVTNYKWEIIVSAATKIELLLVGAAREGDRQVCFGNATVGGRSFMSVLFAGCTGRTRRWSTVRDRMGWAIWRAASSRRSRWSPARTRSGRRSCARSSRRRASWRASRSTAPAPSSSPSRRSCRTASRPASATGCARWTRWRTRWATRCSSPGSRTRSRPTRSAPRPASPATGPRRRRCGTASRFRSASACSASWRPASSGCPSSPSPRRSPTSSASTWTRTRRRTNSRWPTGRCVGRWKCFRATGGEACPPADAEIMIHFT